MSVQVVVAIALSTLVGVSLGLLGGGGSILAVPLLVYVAGIDVHVAIGMSLAIVGTTSLVGALVHARGGRVDLRAALLFGAAGMTGAPVGAQVSHAVPRQVLLLLFAGLMIAVGGLMLRGRRTPGTASTASRRNLAAVLGAGVGVGALTGFLGVGGGFLIVPALTLLARLPIHTAVGTSLLVIAVNAAAGLAGHLRQGPMPLDLTAAFTTASVIGALVGVPLAARVDAARLRRAFAVFVIVIGLALLAANVHPG